MAEMDSPEDDLRRVVERERELKARTALRCERERVSETVPPQPSTHELVKSVEQLRNENAELRMALRREGEELAGENESIRAVLGASWR
jgi:hypothetical protein